MKIDVQPNESLQHLGRLIDQLRVGVLTTLSSAPNGAGHTLHGRPMATLKMDAEPALWFLTSASSPKMAEMDEAAQVALAYSDGRSDFVSVSGTAHWVHDRAVIRELWTPIAKLWFPTGVDDPDLVALKVSIHLAEYWDGPDHPLRRLFTLGEALVTGKASALGEHEAVRVRTGT
jgi:general stress protein 26